MATKLASLSAPTWGERFTLARRRSGKSLERVADEVSQVTPISYGTLVRLEKLTDAPADKKRRFIAFLALLSLGYDPADFGIGLDDVPRWITMDRLSELVESWNLCSGDFRMREPVPA